MNRYPLWTYIVIVVALLFGAFYTAPNFFGEAPAVQVSSQKTTVKVEPALMSRVEGALEAAKIKHDGMFFETLGLNSTVRVRFLDTDTQLKAKDIINAALNPDPADPTYVVALNLVPRTPQWLIKARALPMYLGLDLRGGVHFLMQVDMKEAVAKRVESSSGDVRTLLRDKKVRHSGIQRSGNEFEIRFNNEADRTAAAGVIRDSLGDLVLREEGSGSDLRLVATLSPTAVNAVQTNAIKQNITTLHNRINELGVAEPVIQQQGADRVVVQLPGVQDTAKAKEIIGRTATLEVRLVCEAPEDLAALASGQVPFGCERYLERNGAPLLVKRQLILTGENLNDAQAGFDNQTNEPAVHLTLDAKGARIFRDVTRENVGKRMAILLFEKGKGEVVTAPVIRTEIGGGRVQISGRMTTQEANDVALLLRAGSLAAPMEIVEERTIGPSLGAENIQRGFYSTLYGFTAIAVFMILYYRVFGLISVIALTSNVMLLIALLSLLQATLTLPGIAAVALTLGMSIDANVLINERVREELRSGRTPQQAIHEGYDKAFATILDSNVTTLIAGVALLTFGSGPVRGFAVVHCLGILTSIFTAVFVSRAIVNLVYGTRKRLGSLSVGQVWRPGTEATRASA
ncbi:MAG TPA: protein translocase subunit SecD [Burkholderiaceae bacterium]|nr:protein translocase subunit SecD [Burkholderiaceae bacterium]